MTAILETGDSYKFLFDETDIYGLERSQQQVALSKEYIATEVVLQAVELTRSNPRHRLSSPANVSLAWLSTSSTKNPQWPEEEEVSQLISVSAASRRAPTFPFL